MKRIRLTTPLEKEAIEKLKVGDEVYINGIVYTARDSAHKRIVEAIRKGEKPPFDLRGQIIYYTGPSPTRPGRIIGAIGPTTSYRMDSYAPTLMKAGIRGMLGKGKRSPIVISAIKKHKCVYFVATGGIGALLSESVKKAEIVAYEDLGTEAIYKLELKDFPAIVANDSYGNDLYQERIKKRKK